MNFEFLHQLKMSLRGLRFPILFIRRLLLWIFGTFRPFVCPHGFNINYPLEFRSYWYFFIMREFESHSGWINRLREQNRPHILDIGAHYGVFSRYIKHLNSDTAIVAFEPQSEKVNYLLGIPGLMVKQMGLSSKNGLAKMHVNNDIGILGPDGESEIEIRRLDDLGYAPFLVKIDVEGHELELVKGGIKTLSKTPFVIIETCDHLSEIKNLLHNHECIKLTIIDYLFIKTTLTNED